MTMASTTTPWMMVMMMMMMMMMTTITTTTTTTTMKTVLIAMPMMQPLQQSQHLEKVSANELVQHVLTCCSDVDPVRAIEHFQY